MRRVRVRKTQLKKAHIGPFEAGQIKTHVYWGLGPSAICRIITKPDGKSKYCRQAITDCITKLEDEPTWRGEREKGSTSENNESAGRSFGSATHQDEGEA